MQYVLTIFYEGADLHKSIFLNAFKDGIIAIWERASCCLLMLSAKQGNHEYEYE